VPLLLDPDPQCRQPRARQASGPRERTVPSAAYVAWREPDRPNPMSPGIPWSPRAGELLPRAAEATGVRLKLAGYSLNMTHEDGGPKARGFERVLGITIDAIDYLEEAIYRGILVLPVRTVRDNPPWGVICVVMVPVRGLGEKSERVVDVRTAWALDYPGAAPRLASAYLRP
jgi:hypothetical protein